MNNVAFPKGRALHSQSFAPNPAAKGFPLQSLTHKTEEH